MVATVLVGVGCRCSWLGIMNEYATLALGDPVVVNDEVFDRGGPSGLVEVDLCKLI